MNKKQHNKANSQNNWIDPFYLNELLTEEELSIQKTTQNYCKTKLLPKVIEYNKKCFFDKKIFCIPYSYPNLLETLAKRLAKTYLTLS